MFGIGAERRPRWIVGLLLLLSGCLSVPAEQRSWIEVQTEHFTLWSALGQRDTVELAQELERFRDVVELITNVSSLEAPVPTLVYLFDSRGAFAPFRKGHAVGYFIPGMRGNYVALVRVGDIESRSVLLHEYVHFVLHNQGAIHYPRWFDEGFAELLSALEITDGAVVIGALPEERRGDFAYTRWIPMRRILSGERYEDWSWPDRSKFYAQAWALVHYLQMEEFRVELSDRMTRYLARERAGDPGDVAFESAFGIGPAELDGRLHEYLTRPSLPAIAIGLEALPEPRSASIRALPAGEAALRLGVLALVIGEAPLAQALFERAVAADPRLARAYAGLGDAHKFQQLWDEARPFYERSLALDGNDAENHLDWAEYLHDRALESGAAERRELLRDARRAYVRSYRLAPSLPETYAMYGSTFLVDGEAAARGVETLEHAHGLLQSNLGIMLMLARAYVEVDRQAEARDLLKTVIAWSHEDEQVEQARALLTQIGPTPDDPGDADVERAGPGAGDGGSTR